MDRDARGAVGLARFSEKQLRGNTMSRMLLAFILATTMYGAAWAQQAPLTFRDLRPGVSTGGDFMRVFPSGKCNVAGIPSGSELPSCDDIESGSCDSKKPSAALAGGPDARRAHCIWFRSTSGADRSGLYGGGLNLATVIAQLDDDGKLASINVGLMSAASYEFLLAAMTEKFGKPKVEVSEVQNKMGAKFDQQIATWHVDGVTLEFKKRSGDLETSSLRLITDAEQVRQIEDTKLRIKGAVLSL